MSPSKFGNISPLWQYIAIFYRAGRWGVQGMDPRWAIEGRDLSAGAAGREARLAEGSPTFRYSSGCKSTL